MVLNCKLPWNKFEINIDAPNSCANPFGALNSCANQVRRIRVQAKWCVKLLCELGLVGARNPCAGVSFLNKFGLGCHLF